MPFNRRVPFFNHKNQQTLDTLRQLEQQQQQSNKQRSNSQKPSHNNNHGINYESSANDDDDDEDLKSEKLFHTICGGNLSSEFLIPCAKNVNWVR
ncbi:hypothetical protein BLA29_013187 [Euroglyphus maynei]|uniref:Uncharacterized protein n=1 Tax=Euroglyphus maynei TaxID=6958 RepID=A0A1Y3AL02_EURMA|nr:hypothetical protein BLA29_013187 [Euroglyphus maynei]